MRIVFFWLLLLSLAESLSAHPVIYKNGWVYWGEFRGDMNLQKLSYSFHPRFSIEANSYEFDRLDEYRDYKLGLNTLVKRWYGADSQGNIYVSAQGGYFQQRQSVDGFVGHGMIMGDWESRRLFTAGSVMGLYFNEKWHPKYTYRFGVAPFVGGMDALQTWLIFQLSYFEAESNKLNITPMMRFFYKNVLWEMGSSLDGEFFLALMVHY